MKDVKDFKEISDEKIKVRPDPNGWFTAIVFYTQRKGFSPNAASVNGKTEAEAISNLKKWLYYVGMGDNQFQMPPL